MKKNFYKEEKNKTDHTKFGGTVYISDFNTNHTNGNIAIRIANDQRFDEQCRKNLINRNF